MTPGVTFRPRFNKTDRRFGSRRTPRQTGEEIMSLIVSDTFEPYYAGKPQATRQRAKSATKASSTIMPDAVARKRELPTGSIRPSSLKIATRSGESGRPASDS